MFELRSGLKKSYLAAVVQHSVKPGVMDNEITHRSGTFDDKTD